MEKTKWKKFNPVFLDPMIKNADQDLYYKIESYFSGKEYDLFSSLKDCLQVKSLFPIILFSSKRYEMEMDFFKNPSAFYIEYSESNMSLFSTDDIKLNLDYYQKIKNEVDFEHTLQLVKVYQSFKVSEVKNEIFNKALTYLKKNSTTKQLKEKELSQGESLFIEEFENDIFQFSRLSLFLDYIDQFNKKSEIKINVYTAPEVFSKELDLLPLEYKHSVLFLEIKIDKPSKEHLIPYLYETIFHCISRLTLNEVKAEILNELEDIFQKVEIPVAVFDKNQDLTLHNNHFIGLNLSAKKCFTFTENDQITIEKKVFKVSRINMNNGEYIQFNFLPVKEVLEVSSSPSSEELGIVSSSIAHELNNPLAGILAAITVLEMDDYSEEIMTKFSQMKDSVIRCKQLVETFLGFSKVKHDSKSSSISIKEGFNQAMELVRFRLIENNISLSHEYKRKQEFEGELNKHIMSMIFYLFLGEFLTCFSHQNLVQLKNSLKVNINVSENKEEIRINFPDGMNISSSFLESKLVSHLLESQSLSLDHGKDYCSFFYKAEAGKL